MSYGDIIIYAGLCAIIAICGGLIVYQQMQLHRQMQKDRAEHEAWRALAKARREQFLSEWPTYGKK